MATEIKRDLYIIECITNLHVGSGDIDFGLIDNRVQRDVLTEFPTINSSSLKGALRASFDDEELVLEIFGGESKGETKTKQGKYKFFPANLLAIPVRSDVEPYFMATCPQILEDFSEMLYLFGKIIESQCLKTKAIEYKEKLKEKQVLISNQYSNLTIEEIQNSEIGKLELEKFMCLEHLGIEGLKKEKIVILSNKLFKELVSELPVIARNHLENGESKNLWYEEIVPRKTLFYFGIDKGKFTPNDENNNEFDNRVNFKKSNELVSIGGNVTVGYGACKIIKLGESRDK